VGGLTARGGEDVLVSPMLGERGNNESVLGPRLLHHKGVSRGREPNGGGRKKGRPWCFCRKGEREEESVFKMISVRWGANGGHVFRPNRMGKSPKFRLPNVSGKGWDLGDGKRKKNQTGGEEGDVRILEGVVLASFSEEVSG